MITRLFPVLIFAAVAIAVISLINKSFTNTYSQVKNSVEKPYARAQAIYEEEATR